MHKNTTYSVSLLRKLKGDRLRNLRSHSLAQDLLNLPPEQGRGNHSSVNFILPPHLPQIF